MTSKTTLLAILQQSEYDVRQLAQWIQQHGNENQKVEPKEWTLKLKLISALMSVFFFLPLLLRVKLAVFFTRPIEAGIRQAFYLAASLKLRWLKFRGLTVIAIAGSYAKTSTKHIMFHTLSGSTSVYMTPKSINTLLGVAQVILKELHSEHKVFIVEMGEYHQKDIQKLCRFSSPDYGVLTPIGRQHLDIIGGFENIVKEMGYFLAHFEKHPENVLVHEKNQLFFAKKNLQFYGEETINTVRAFDIIVNRAGTEFSLHMNGLEQPLSLFTPLFGEHQAINILPAFWVAQKMGIPVKEIAKRVGALPFIPHRHEPQFIQNNVLILDNGYNTNPDSVKESLKLLNQLEPSRKIIVTLGFVETGDEGQKLHYEFGQLLAKHVDYLGLISSPFQNQVAEGFLEAGGKKDAIVIGKSQAETLQLIQPWVVPNCIILLEGGYQELYG